MSMAFKQLQELFAQTVGITNQNATAINETKAIVLERVVEALL